MIGIVVLLSVGLSVVLGLLYADALHELDKERRLRKHAEWRLAGMRRAMTAINRAAQHGRHH